MAGTPPRCTLQEITDTPRIASQTVIAHGLEVTELVVPVACLGSDDQPTIGDLKIRTILGSRYENDGLTQAVSLETVFYAEHASLYATVREFVLNERQQRTEKVVEPEHWLIADWEGEIDLSVVADFEESVCPLADNLFDSRLYDGDSKLRDLPRLPPEGAHLSATGHAHIVPSNGRIGEMCWLRDQRKIRKVTLPLIVMWDATTHIENRKIKTELFYPLGVFVGFEGGSKLRHAAENCHRLHLQRR